MTETAPRPVWKRLAWFGGLWAASVLSLGVVAGALKLLFNMILK